MTSATSLATTTAAGAIAAAAFDPDLWDRILAFDLSVVTTTFAERSAEYGADAEALELQTKRFLYLAALLPDVELAPTKPIDDYWHQMILFTGIYHDFCRTFGGAYIQHNPLAGPDHAQIFGHTQHLVRHHFGDDFQGHEFWTLPMPATSCRCTNVEGRIVYN